jgi:guanine deaminase
MNKYMKMAYCEALKNPLSPLASRKGGPFGAVLVGEDGEIFVARNEVKETNDPTMHAEIVAIRKASEKRGMAYLKTCVIYCTCYPCPMCLGAIHWAGINRVYYGCRPTDVKRMNLSAEDIKHLDDVPAYALILREAKGFEIEAEKEESIWVNEIDRDECSTLYTEWSKRVKPPKKTGV